MFLTLPPEPRLAPLVHAYWFIEDIPGRFEGCPVRTSPIPAAVLSVNLGRPNAAEDGSLVPRVSLLGLQSRARSWQSWSDTYFVMAMLTLPGLLRLFPHTGSGTSNRLMDLGAIVGDKAAGSLASGVSAALTPTRVVEELDRHLLQTLAASQPVPEAGRLADACRILHLGGSVEKAAAQAQVNRRQLHRWFRRHFGMGPKEVADLGRLQRSIRSVQIGQGEPVAGFSDQAHQIRSWRRRLGVTPGAYRQAVRMPAAGRFGSTVPANDLAFYH